MFASAENACIALSTAPSMEHAAAIAHQLVEEKLAACVNIVPGIRSIYRWEGAVVDDGECLLLVKTSRSCLDALEHRLHQLHPYEVPEFLALFPESGSAAYLRWLDQSVWPPRTEKDPMI